MIIRASIDPVMGILKSHGYSDKDEGRDEDVDPKKLWDLIHLHVPKVLDAGRTQLLDELMTINVKKYISLQAFLTRYHFLNNRPKTLGIKYGDNLL